MKQQIYKHGAGIVAVLAAAVVVRTPAQAPNRMAG
jgi:hypothetical protein